MVEKEITTMPVRLINTETVQEHEIDGGTFELRPLSWGEDVKLSQLLLKIKGEDITDSTIKGMNEILIKHINAIDSEPNVADIVPKLTQETVIKVVLTLFAISKPSEDEKLN
jgi:hypothetical protein